MLVLSRQIDESIVIGDNVIITVVDIRGDKVRLGIEAPGEVPVHRREVYEALQREARREKGGITKKLEDSQSQGLGGIIGNPSTSQNPNSYEEPPYPGRGGGCY